MQQPPIHHTKPTIIQDSSKSPAFTGSSLTSASNTWQQQSPGYIYKLDAELIVNSSSEFKFQIDVILQKVKVPLILISGPYGVGFLVDSLKEKLLEKLEQFIVNLELDSREFLLLSAASEASTREFVEVVCAYWVIFPDSEQQLIKLAQNLLTRCYLLST
ncbi:hypothetical protein ACSBR1_040844 [Camellia fascicularis]